ncbi:MAG: dienelactone hydrolase family protein [Gemmatimonadota bacterium]
MVVSSGFTMRALVLILAAAGGACSTPRAEPAPDHTEHADTAPPPVAAAPVVSPPAGPALPAGAADAQQRLAASPRHGEWAMIPTGGADSIRAWVVYPERSTPAPVVLVVHEIFGLSNWIRGVADQLAADGFVAIAPDLMTAHNLPADAAGDPIRDQATATIRTLDPDVYHRQLLAIGTWGMALPAASDSYGIVGFCWGGSASFRHAVESSRVGAAVVYYGSSPDPADLPRVRAPVLGLYGGDDARVNATVAPADSAMKALDKAFAYHMFEGAGHGFLRQQDGRPENLVASQRAWPLTVEFFRQHLD